MDNAVDTGWFQRHYFLIKRVHSLSGIVPVGVFLTVHLTINSTIVAGPDAFQTAVDGIHLLDKVGLLTAVEIVGIFLPLLFHATLGVWIWRTGRQNVATYRYGGNVRYTAQRITGIIALLFILYHLWHMHWLGKPFGGAEFDPHDAASTAAAALQPWYLRCGYAIGVLAAVFHLANGIWTSMITWGITIGPRSQRWTGWACAAFGVMLALAGLGSLRGFGTLPPDTQPPHADPTTELVDQPGQPRTIRGPSASAGFNRAGDPRFRVLAFQRFSVSVF
ncbi:MAG: succinate dehydrogenase [bacterium]|nr:succinate dehydrogenase [bacterium]